MTKRALITGISGQDGAYLAKFLLGKGYRVKGVIRNNSSLSGLKALGIYEQVEIDLCDLESLSSLSDLIAEFSPHEIYNLSAQSSVYESFQKPLKTISYNVLSVLNLLEVVRKSSRRIKLYQASSSDMFGNSDILPITIDMPMRPESPYALSKISAHLSVVSYRESYDVFAVSGILFNHESILRSDNFFIKKIISESVDLYQGLRDQIYVGNLNIRRDFGYAPKYVEAMWLMLQNDIPKDYLICSGVSVSLKSIVRYIFNELGLDYGKVVVDEDLLRPREIYEIYGDNTKALEELGWEYSVDFFSVIKILLKHELEKRDIILSLDAL